MKEIAGDIILGTSVYADKAYVSLNMPVKKKKGKCVIPNLLRPHEGQDEKRE